MGLTSKIYFSKHLGNGKKKKQVCACIKIKIINFFYITSYIITYMIFLMFQHRDSSFHVSLSASTLGGNMYIFLILIKYHKAFTLIMEIIFIRFSLFNYLRSHLHLLETIDSTTTTTIGTGNFLGLKWISWLSPVNLGLFQPKVTQNIYKVSFNERSRLSKRN